MREMSSAEPQGPEPQGSKPQSPRRPGSGSDSTPNKPANLSSESAKSPPAQKPPARSSQARSSPVRNSPAQSDSAARSVAEDLFDEIQDEIARLIAGRLTDPDSGINYDHVRLVLDRLCLYMPKTADVIIQQFSPDTVESVIAWSALSDYNKRRRLQERVL